MIIRSFLRKMTNKQLSDFLASDYFADMFEIYQIHYKHDNGFFNSWLNTKLDEQTENAIKNTYSDDNTEKLLFLDIDGVIMTLDYIHKVRRENKSINSKDIDLPDETMKLVKTIVDKTDARIIISSSYRKDKDLLLYLTKQFDKYDLEIYGITPSDASRIRGWEISEYIDNFCYENNININNIHYVILDDDSADIIGDKFFSDCHKNSFVKVNTNNGLTTDIANKVISMLNNGVNKYV